MFNFLFNISKLLIYSFYIKNKLKYIKNISNKDLNIWSINRKKIAAIIAIATTIKLP